MNIASMSIERASIPNDWTQDSLFWNDSMKVPDPPEWTCLAITIHGRL